MPLAYGLLVLGHVLMAVGYSVHLIHTLTR
jgi:hypothetical protein